MGITGLLPFIEKASRRTNVSEFNGCTVAIDSYCWLHKGAFACADRLVLGEETDVYIKYCLKYVSMLLSKNIKPILVFDGRHLPAKAMTESKRRESRAISKKRAAELLSLGKMDEARSYMRRSVDITHKMALNLIQECRKRNVDCIVAPYEADAQLAYLNIKNIAHLVITEDSDLILFGCSKVLFKMDLDGTGTLVETNKLPFTMKCPIEHYTFDKFRQMCIMSGCDYLTSLPGIGLVKARQFVMATQDPNFANALKKLPSFFNKPALTVTDEYRENFLKAEATFKHQYVYDPIDRRMVRLTDTDDEDIERALCVNAGELLEPDIAFQLALGNLDPFTLKEMDDWHPDSRNVQKQNGNIKTNGWKEIAIAKHTSMWSPDYKQHLDDASPWQKKVKKLQPIIAQPTTRPRPKVVNLVSKCVPETQDESLSIESLSSMYCVEPATKRPKLYQDVTQCIQNHALTKDSSVGENSRKTRSPILENKERSFRKGVKKNILKGLSRFPRTVLNDNVVESTYFSTSNSVSDNNASKDSIRIDESPEKCSRNPFKISSNRINENTSSENVSTSSSCDKTNETILLDCDEDIQCKDLESSQKENSPANSPMKRSSPILEPSPRISSLFRKLESKLDQSLSEDSVIENTYPMETLITPVDSQESFGQSPPKPLVALSYWSGSQPLQRKAKPQDSKKSKASPGKKKMTPLPSNQPTLLSKFGFQRKPSMKR